MSLIGPHQSESPPIVSRGRDQATRWILGLAAALLAVQLLVALVNFTPLVTSHALLEPFEMNAEATLVVWFSSTLLLVIGLGAALAAAAERAHGAPARVWKGWSIVSAAFVLLSIDEVAALHERAGDGFSQVVEIGALPGVFGWVVIVAPVAFLLSIWMVRWFSTIVGLASATGRLALCAVALWVFVPLLESFDPRLDAPTWLIVTEETFETMGATLMLVGVLFYLRDRGLLRLPEIQSVSERPSELQPVASAAHARAARLTPVVERDVA